MEVITISNKKQSQRCDVNFFFLIIEYQSGGPIRDETSFLRGRDF